MNNEQNKMPEKIGLVLIKSHDSVHDGNLSNFESKFSKHGKSKPGDTLTKQID